MTTRIVWKEPNALLHFAKHKVSFEVAQHVFADPLAFAAMDRIENGEHRWQTIGMVYGQLVLLVAHTVNHDDDGCEIIEIISARKADRTERERYEENYRIQS